MDAFLKSLHLSLKSVAGLSAEVLPVINEDVVLTGMSYVLIATQDQVLPAYIDEGSYFSIISADLLGKLGISVTGSESKLLKPLSGPAVSIKGSVTLDIEFADDVVVPILFRVMESPGVSLILGLDVCQALNASREYDTHSIIWNGLEPTLRSDLLTKEDVVSALEEVYDDSEESNEVPGMFLQVEQVWA